MSDRETIGRSCSYCGAVNPGLFGPCEVCGYMVCDHCGNVQHVRGNKRVTHNKCLTKDAGGFSMIKFVK